MENKMYQAALPPDTTLCVYEGERLIFSSSGKWLMPIFELEDFLATYAGSKVDLRAHDTAVGKAAAVIMVRLGIQKIHANLASVRARQYIDSLNVHAGQESVSFSFERIVPKLLCATEDILESMTDNDEMYRMLRQRAKLVQGASVLVEHLSCPYGSIRDLSFEIPAGGNLLIIGENGSGKTTLLRHLTGKLVPASGRVLIGGKELGALPPRTICYVPQQQDNKFFSLSVEEVVSLGLSRHEKDSAKEIREAMARTDCAYLLGRGFSSLSGGEKQKVSLARCLAQKAGVLLLDEPTSALDDSARNMVAGVLRSLSVTEIPTIVTVTHDASLVSALGWETLPLGFAS